MIPHSHSHSIHLISPDHKELRINASQLKASSLFKSPAQILRSAACGPLDWAHLFFGPTPYIPLKLNERLCCVTCARDTTSENWDLQISAYTNWVTLILSASEVTKNGLLDTVTNRRALLIMHAIHQLLQAVQFIYNTLRVHAHSKSTCNQSSPY